MVLQQPPHSGSAKRVTQGVHLPDFAADRPGAGQCLFNGAIYYRKTASLLLIPLESPKFGQIHESE